MARIYLIRHGKPTSSWGGAEDDPGLDETGWAQAMAARDALLALPPEERPARVVSSPLRRCRETAQPLAAALGVEVEIDRAVGEIPTPATLEAAARSDWLKRTFAGTWAAVEGDLDYDAWRREVACSLIPRGGTAVFSHFVAINGVLSVLEDDDRVVGFRPDHASIQVLDSERGVLTLVAKGREGVTGVL